MKTEDSVSDLFVLVADKSMKLTIKSLLEKKQDALGIKVANFIISTHKKRDPGCRSSADAFLRDFSKSFRYALVVFDHEGCGDEKKTAGEIEAKIEDRLSKNGWKNRAAVICIKPELEIWVWPDNEKLLKILGWQGNRESLLTWLKENKCDKGMKCYKKCRKKKDIQVDEFGKPHPPKCALNRVLWEDHKILSSSIHKNFFTKVEETDVSDCKDRAFNKFKETLREWFPGTSQEIPKGKISTQHDITGNSKNMRKKKKNKKK